MLPRHHPSHPSRRPYGARVATLCLMAAVPSILAACSNPTGRAAVSASNLLQQASSALGKEPSIHLAGEVTATNHGQSNKITVDATSDDKGSSEGTLGLEGKGLGFAGSAQFIIVGTALYLMGGTDFWNSVFLFGKPTAAAEKLDKALVPQVLNRWIEMPSAGTQTFRQDALGLSDPRVWAHSALTGLKGTLSNAGNRPLSGKQGVLVISSSGADCLIAATGTPLPLVFAATTVAAGTNFVLSLLATYPGSAVIAAPSSFESLQTLEQKYANG